jgi:hypothetical protein
MAMNTHLHEQLIRERLDEARAMAAHLALVRTHRPARRPVRVTVGFALIRIGHWVAGRTVKLAARPRRATA